MTDAADQQLVRAIDLARPGVTRHGRDQQQVARRLDALVVGTSISQIPARRRPMSRSRGRVPSSSTSRRGGFPEGRRPTTRKVIVRIRPRGHTVLIRGSPTVNGASGRLRHQRFVTIDHCPTDRDIVPVTKPFETYLRRTAP